MKLIIQGQTYFTKISNDRCFLLAPGSHSLLRRCVATFTAWQNARQTTCTVSFTCYRSKEIANINSIYYRSRL